MGTYYLKTAGLYLFVFLIIISSCSKKAALSEHLPREIKISGIYPEQGQPGSLVKISGTGFIQENFDVAVKFDSIQADVIESSDTEMLIRVPKDTGSVTIIIELNGERITGPVFTYIPIDWMLETENAGWAPRDSQGEVVFKDKLWIFGGWFSSYDTSFRDVWNSDGKTWNLVNPVAPWIHGDLLMSITFKDKIWAMGGVTKSRLPDRSVTGEIWSSDDGINWNLENGSAQWGPRVASAVVEFKGKIWVLGGLAGEASNLTNDVWYSENGKDWVLAVESAEWSPRAYHQVVAFNGKLYLMGGGNYFPSYYAFNDVWSSEDGVHWELESEAAPWHKRIWFSSVIYRDRMWVLGGWTGDPNTNWADLWYSADGREWKQFHTENIWMGRHEHSALIFQDKIWVAGGYTGTTLMNDVWSLSIPEHYFNQ